MISSLRGRALHLDPDSVVVDVGGVGYAVAVPSTLSRTYHVGDEMVLHTSMIVREDALSLYGFETREELTVFGQLLSVSGVGPKSALGVLSQLSVGQIADAVIAEDDAPFRRVSGIGPKTAKLIVVQLAGKLQPPARVTSGGAAAAAPAAVSGQVVAALVALGWTERVALDAVGVVMVDAPEDERQVVPALLKRALAHLGPAARAEAAGD